MNTVQPKILVVEDESIVAAHISESLKHSGYRVTDTVPSGEQALKSVRQNTPDLVLMDIVLKGKLGGIEAAELIYSRYDVPIIFLTAYFDPKTLNRAKTAHPFGYLLKPFKEKDLHTSIEVALDKHQQEKRLKGREEWFSCSLKNLSEPVLATNTQGVITFFNRAAQKLTGWKEKNVVGKRIQDRVQRGKKEKRTRHPVARVIQEGVSLFQKNCRLCGDRPGRDLSVDLSVSPIQTREGVTIGAVLICHPASDAEPRGSTARADSGTGWASEVDPDFSGFVFKLCPWCKKILNENTETWEAVEVFFNARG
ncbi:MAG: response regulator, partial [Nitrospinaceae bacterium]|nr:response regulator [Nitrospinaceae bacterium]NIR53882.1 response regulator [Nitrospinaceae bacterium]NIS84296.1 response regulator [Nitrospinaceae bacterium]NIT81103.1 response regulator [Nitrospinaceae bacterium]NIU43385.1 response regulator [Nitrospinaceae bacterium]